MRKNEMQTVRVKLNQRSYNIYIANNILDRLGAKLKSLGLNQKVAIISNPTVYKLYGKKVFNSLKSSGFNIVTVIIPDGEKYKNISTIQKIYTKLLKYKFDRKSTLIALGGGVIGDITGFIASTYMRGVGYIHVPTTLLTQVDSSVGGKTGINHKLGKNMIGTFYQPKLVWIDIDTLKTLPKRELIAGLAEVIKYGIVRDKKLFEFLENNHKKILHLDKIALGHIIKCSCKIKAKIVSSDEKEAGLRAILNYGHTIGHAIETATKYKKFLHGEAIAIGMHIEAKLSAIMKCLKKQDVLRIKSLLNIYDLPSEIPSRLNINTIISSMLLDKKAVDGKLRIILPKRIGNGELKKIEEIKNKLKKIKNNPK